MTGLDLGSEISKMIEEIRKLADMRLKHLMRPTSDDEYKSEISGLALDIWSETGRKCDMRESPDSVYEFEFRETMDDVVVEGYSFTDRHPIKCELQGEAMTLFLEIEGVEVSVTKEHTVRSIRAVEDWNVKS
jgi:hypothetical protein